MKSLLYVSLWGTLLLLFGCKTENLHSPQTEAIITGHDLALCACCGGLMITTSDDPETYSDQYYQLSNQADFPDLDLSEFPIYIKMDFEIDSSRCVDFRPWINVLELEVVE